MGLFSMRLVQHIPGVSRVYRNVLGFTSRITRHENLVRPGKSFISVAKSLELSDIAHGKYANYRNYIHMRESIYYIARNLKESKLLRFIYNSGFDRVYRGLRKLG